MPVSDLNDIVGSLLLDQSNYDGGSTRFIDASKFANHLTLQTGTPLWATVAGHEGLDLDNQFYFEFENYPCIPKGSLIYAINLNANVSDGSLQYMHWFYGQEISGDHVVSNYNPSIDPFATSIRDQVLYCSGNNVRTADNTAGANVSQAVVADTWYIVTSVYELLPAKIRQALNDGVFSETAVATSYLLNTFGNIFRLGQLNSSFPAVPAVSNIRLGEVHLFQGDVSQQAGYAAVITELKAKYGIP